MFEFSESENDLIINSHVLNLLKTETRPSSNKTFDIGEMYIHYPSFNGFDGNNIFTPRPPRADLDCPLKNITSSYNAPLTPFAGHTPPPFTSGARGEVEQ